MNIFLRILFGVIIGIIIFVLFYPLIFHTPNLTKEIIIKREIEASAGSNIIKMRNRCCEMNTIPYLIKERNKIYVVCKPVGDVEDLYEYKDKCKIIMVDIDSSHFINHERN